ncbi:MAG TPA: NADH-quinone oxidoreductase subunit C [Thiotrichaceae bacterium]|jgi:NADH-quinone oxidoreductase subunit C|nr:NADH-quinone oxidoreductase subunit C [Thiotrichaceae bacterium]HIM07812.1 NADH-quinone oxidoreductase subunit C [Gammaproteobacteria bacterium]
MESAASLKIKLEERFSDESVSCVLDRGQVTMEFPAEHVLSVCKALRDDKLFSFSQLSDVCGVDYSEYGEVNWVTHETTSTGFSRGRESESQQKSNVYNNKRFAVVYHLLSLKNNIRLRLRCFVSGEPPRISSVTNIWSSADWFERETFDLFGILFDGHPDLRRILTDYGFIGHPFRKDFPLEGNVEVRYDEDKKRVVYQPVTITNRVLVPRVIREDNRYIAVEEELNDG